MRRAYAWIGTLGLAAMAMTVSPAVAQSNDEIFPQFQWNFATPGARANGMGRAFIGLADDASASITNPAGLLQLSKRQGYFEFKNTDVRVARVAAPDGFFQNPVTARTVSTRINVPAFASVSMPFRGRFAIGFTRHEFLNYREQFSLEPRVVPGPTATPDETLFAVDGSSNFSGTSYAGSVAMSVNEKLQVGATVSLDYLNASSVATRIAVAVGPTFDSNRFDVHRRTVGGVPLLVNQMSVNDHSAAVSFVIGALYHASEKLTVGAEFAKGANMSVSENLQTNPGFTASAGDTNQPLQTFTGFPKTIPINVPNRLGGGVAYRHNSRLTVALDAVWLNYSRLAKDFVIVLDAGNVNGNQFSIANVLEVHGGAEYLLRPGARPIYVRGGFFTAPDHATKFTPSPTPVTGAVLDVQSLSIAIYNTLPRGTKVYGTVGVGFVLGQRAQLDVAYVGTREFVASIGARF